MSSAAACPDGDPVRRAIRMPGSSHHAPYPRYTTLAATLDPQSAEKPTMYTSPLRDFAKSMEAATLAQAKDVEAQVDPPSKE